MQPTKVLISLVFLGFFVFVWADICWDVLTFDPTPDKKTVGYSDLYVAVAGGLATTLSAAVGAVLGVKANPQAFGVTAFSWGSAFERIKGALTASTLTFVTLVVYVVFAVLVGILTLKKSDVAPELLITFGLSIFGLVGATFTAALAKPR